MKRLSPILQRKTWIAGAFLLAASGAGFGATELKNLALNKPATASASEDNNTPADAVDGNDGTRWCNADASVDCWWQVDLGAEQKLGGCYLTWEHDGAVYQFIVEGSADGKTWKPLNDQRGSGWNAADQKLLLAGDAARYVRVRVTGLEDGSWASFFECALYSAEEMKKLTPEELKAFHAPAPLGTNLALKKSVSTSSNEDAHPATDANDGDDATRWCAVDGSTDQWWMVDLADKPAATGTATAAASAPSQVKIVKEVDIRWEQQKAYQYIVESSVDAKKWETLSDQKANAAQAQTAQLRFAPHEARYVKITVTGLEEGAYASIAEVKVIGTDK
ncbi:MAG TPA: discoidin domain-containing protein [Phycisphaerae bacterium]|jgi:hypothetical protein|nr:discoidin domain-containing protein [Phycisphaerae bacterium]